MQTKEERKRIDNLWRKNNPDKVRAQKRRWQQKNKDKSKQYFLKYIKDKNKAGYWSRKKTIMAIKARKIGREFNLTWQDIKELNNSDCTYCGFKYLIMTIDRKNNDIGYLKDNCVAACHNCNQIKGEFISFEEMKNIGSRIKNSKINNPERWKKLKYCQQLFTP